MCIHSLALDCNRSLSNGVEIITINKNIRQTNTHRIRQNTIAEDNVETVEEFTTGD